MRLFISYAYADKPLVDTLLVQPLRAHQHEVWIDEYVGAGRAWKPQLASTIRDSDAMVVALTMESAHSEVCKREIAAAVELGKPVALVLVRADTVVPSWMSDLKILDFSGGIPEDGIEQILAGLQQLTLSQIPVGFRGFIVQPIPRTFNADQDEDENFLPLPAGFTSVMVLVGVFMVALLAFLAITSPGPPAPPTPTRAVSVIAQLTQVLSQTQTTVPTATMTPTLTLTSTELPAATRALVVVPTASPTPSPTSEPTRTPALASLVTNTPADTATDAPSPVATSTELPTLTPTTTPADTATDAPTPTLTATEPPTLTPTSTPADTATDAPTPTLTATELPTSTPTLPPSANEPTLTTTPTAWPTSIPLSTAELPTQPSNLAAVPTVAPLPADAACENLFSHPMAFIDQTIFFRGVRDDETGADDERPGHYVTLSAYCIDRYEVTNEAYQVCMLAGSCTAPKTSDSTLVQGYFDTPDYARFPVININWDQAQSYCTYRGGRLPTEAEWELVARDDPASGQMLPYPWGTQTPSAERVNAQVSGRGDTAAVGQLPDGMNAYGVFDLSGNAAEWVYDWYGPYVRQNTINPQGPETGTERVVRGGSFASDSSALRGSARAAQSPVIASPQIGFRCVIAPRIQP